MKPIFFKISIIISLLFTLSCKSQSVNDYIAFYNNLVPKLNILANVKTQFYGQNFSVFYNEMLNKQVNVVKIDCDTKVDPSSKYYILRLYFEDSDLWSVATDNPFQYPWVSITFENEIPNQINNMVLQNHGEWNNTFVQFFSNMKIEKIKFIGINGYNSTDWSEK
ncbi:hypothetical protein [Chryseobacterium cheonjiense]|uniref:Lipoprotein n=1 Tax=Chryseobacterium cheonjiense TaxID=2728845 RepID=A0A7Y0A4J4_9FLAO|nr:hypothetical protein [Chryseobacterium cheonjiense]NML56539.1 hypothetical protein [Chryseobacterium cheonjiense]